MWFHAFAYQAKSEDEAILKDAKMKIQAMFPEQYVQLQKMEKFLERYLQNTIKKSPRTLFIARNILQYIKKTLYQQEVFCLQAQVQKWDTVTISYTLQGQTGNIIKKSKNPLLFNPGSQNMRKVIAESVWGIKKEQIKVLELFPVSWVKTSKEWEKVQSLQKLEAKVGQDLLPWMQVWDTLVLGSTKSTQIISARIVKKEGTDRVLDFSISSPENPLYLRIKALDVNKFCQQKDL